MSAINYGDENFVEYGGCIVMPVNDHCFEVFKVDTELDEADSISAVLLFVNVFDDWIKYDDILYASGLEDLIGMDVTTIMPLSQWASEIAQYYDFNNFSPIYYHDDDSLYPRNIVTREQLRQWMMDMGLEAYLDKEPLNFEKSNQRIYEEYLNRIILAVAHNCRFTRQKIVKKAAKDMEDLISREDLLEAFENISVDQLIDIRNVRLE